MSAYELETVLQKWKKGDLTAEQAVGQILLQLQLLSGRVGDLEKRMREERPSSKSTSPGK